jgi:hypothetical protein
MLATRLTEQRSNAPFSKSELAKLLRQADQLSENAVKALLEEFDRLHRDLARQLERGTLSPEQMNKVLEELDPLLRATANRMGTLGLNAHERAWTAGANRTARLLIGTQYYPGGPGGAFLIGPSGFERRALRAFTFDRIVQITEEMRTGVRSTVINAFLSGRSPFDVITDITHVVGIRDLPTFRELGSTGVSYKAERIWRTEINTAQNAAGHLALEDLNERRPGGLALLQRMWLSTGDDRTRDSHLAAHGQIRSEGEPFELDGGDAMYPGDPDLPPEERINCRCREVPWSDEWGERGEVLGAVDDEVGAQIESRAEEGWSVRWAPGRGLVRIRSSARTMRWRRMRV